jgi:anti-sigma factor RsiW
MFENCSEIRSYFSDYLDGACCREVFRSVQFHLTYCASCRSELERREMLQADLRALPPRRVPPELALRLRVELSRHLHRNALGRFMVALDNILKPLLLPASGGVLAAILCFALILGSQIIPAASGPSPRQNVASTPPRIEDLAPLSLPPGVDGVVLVTHIDAEGRVLSYQVLSGKHSPQFLHHLDRMMYFSHFQPAMTDGKPTDGEMVLLLSRITVRG